MKYILSLCILLCLNVVIFAQENTPKIEVFGGYSLTHAFDPSDISNGLNSSINYNLNKYLGIKADFGVQFNGENYSMYYPARTETFVDSQGQTITVNIPAMNLAVRLIQGDLVHARLHGSYKSRENQTFPRLSFGLVLKLGKK